MYQSVSYVNLSAWFMTQFQLSDYLNSYFYTKFIFWINLQL